MLTTIDGIAVNAIQEFVTDEGFPILPDVGYPKAYVLDKDRSVLSVTIASPDRSTPGVWTALLNVPHMGLEERATLTVMWVLQDKHTGNIERVRDTLTVEPEVEQRITDIVVSADDLDYTVVVPYEPSAFAACSVSVYRSNDLLTRRLYERDDVSFGAGRVAIKLPVDVDPSLASGIVSVRITDTRDRVTTLSYKLWKITPQIELSMMHIEDQLNKARLANTIPELEYTPADLLSYLERGLYMFNTLGYTSAFTGTNMHGALLDGHLVCSTYYALCAQIMAESQLAFDFSGQGVSLNVDRTPQLEAAIGRIQQEINERVLPLKKQLARQGILIGDGSVGKGTLRNPKAQGRLGIINAPTTFIPLMVNTRFTGRRS